MTDMTRAASADGEAGRQWLDASVRQCLVELALAGANHGMAHEARKILTALPSLVPDRGTCRWLQAALSIALGDTAVASGLLADARNGAPVGDATAEALACWAGSRPSADGPTAPIAPTASVAPAPIVTSRNSDTLPTSRS
ncbi:type III secretion apparatus [Pandoraea morbifera]|uniref:Type III secretion apparatus n=1 Tax=Pandoraea morbifera TaxID=2508300 RepID=A0A5E4SJ66_9BURK|nr:DUF1039 domain-containing protein [Pandoraea morbifera]VVD75335.1 type III secretion apparatus [Pandoraea morbifera]